MKRFLPLLITLLVSPCFAVTLSPLCEPGRIITSPEYQALLWYQSSAEKNALYRQVFELGELQIKSRVNARHLQAGKWGVIFDIDETLLDTSNYARNQALQCKDHDYDSFMAAINNESFPATPGAREVSCSIQKMGGYVSIVSNRSARVAGVLNSPMIEATVNNLKRQGICFDQIVFSVDHETNKNPRFRAIITGDYSQPMYTTQILPPHLILAYFGDNVQDFPNTFQLEMIAKNDPDSAAYNNFGVFYFLLPNPLYGSWDKNKLSGYVAPT